MRLKPKLGECCVGSQCFTHQLCSCFSNIVVCWNHEAYDNKWYINPLVKAHESYQDQWVLCLFSMLHSLVLPLRHQFCFLWRATKSATDSSQAISWIICFLLTTYIKFRKCCVDFQCFTQWCWPHFSHHIACWFTFKGKCLLISVVCLFVHLPLRTRFVRAELIFNASLNDVVPGPPITFTVCMIMKRRAYSWENKTMLCFHSLIKSSWASVVLIFNASLNDVAPMSPILPSVDSHIHLHKHESEAECLRHKLSFVRVVLAFSASLSDVAPFSLMLFSVVCDENIVFFCLHLISFVLTT